MDLIFNLPNGSQFSGAFQPVNPLSLLVCDYIKPLDADEADDADDADDVHAHDVQAQGQVLPLGDGTYILDLQIVHI